jgi:hypothetical protein
VVKNAVDSKTASTVNKIIRAFGELHPWVGSVLNCEPQEVPFVVSLGSLADKNCGVAPILCQLIVAENSFP